MSSWANGQTCEDDPSFQFLRTKNRNSRVHPRDIKNCKFLENRKAIHAFSASRVRNQCKKPHIKGACQKTCDSCECEDNPNFSFTTRDGEVTCDWITRNRKKMPIRRLNYCYPGSVKSSEGVVSSNCIRSCGLCTGSGESSGAPTSAPIVGSIPSAVPSDSPSMLPSEIPSDAPSGPGSPSEAPSYYIEYNVCPYEDASRFTYLQDDGITSTFKMVRKDDTVIARGCSKITRNNIDKRRNKFCNIHEIKALCPSACAICVKDNKKYEFDSLEGGRQKCDYFIKQDTSDIMLDLMASNCGDKRVRENCSQSCVPVGRLRSDETFKIKTPAAVTGVRG